MYNRAAVHSEAAIVWGSDKSDTTLTTSLIIEGGASCQQQRWLYRLKNVQLFSVAGFQFKQLYN